MILNDAQIEGHRGNWRQLRLENEAFRIVCDNGLASAPITHFDSAITAFVDAEWKKCARVIGEVMAEEMSGPYWQTGDLILWSRLKKLIEAGTFEYRGSLAEMRWCEVRRPDNRA